MEKQTLNNNFLSDLAGRLHALKKQGLLKEETEVVSPQRGMITVKDRTQDTDNNVINLCANNYLGLSNSEELIVAAKGALDTRGFGMSSVRFICGTQDIHKALEQKISEFLGTEDTILFPSCFDANTGLFETLLSEQDAVISDSLNHASIVDGIRLCKAQRFRYKNADMPDLEEQLRKAREARYRMIVTDGVFSMDGTIANLPKICQLAKQYEALVMVDDSHAVGFMGNGGRGTPEHCGVRSRVDIVTGTLGKALGGASGGYVSGKTEVIAWLRQKSRPYLFSNSLAPMIVAASLCALDIIRDHRELHERLWRNTGHFRRRMGDLGFDLVVGQHPIIPIMLHDPHVAQEFAKRLLSKGVYVIAFSYPVVPRGGDRIRTQMSAAHSLKELDRAIAAFTVVGRQLGVIE